MLFSVVGRDRLRAVSLFSWSIEQNARDTQMTTRVKARDGRGTTLVSRVLAAQRSRARARKRETARSLGVG